MNMNALTNFTGKKITPTDGEYEALRNVLMAKGSPAIILQPLNASDVTAAIAFAKTNNLTLSIRSGGHSGGGLSTNEGGVVIDMSPMNKVTVIDHAKNTVRVESGATWVEVASELERHGLAISSGDTSSVGVGGLTLGGGIGWMVRAHGLTIDNLVGAEIVTANGQILTANASHNADLFWAIRGGGGNFGVVTHFDFTAHPVKSVFAGNIMYDRSDLTTTLRSYRDYMRTAPRELTAMFLMMPASGEESIFGSSPATAMVICCYAGDNDAEAQKVIDSLRQLGTVTHQDIRKKNYSEVLEDAHMPGDMRVITNNAFFNDFSDELIETLVRYDDQIVQIRSLGGAIDDHDVTETAFGHRNSEILIVSPVFLTQEALDDEVKLALEPWREISKTGSGSYVNLLTRHGEAETLASYPPATLEKLRLLKAKYDPDNVFNQNVNVAPQE